MRGVSSNARKTAPPPRRSHEMLKSHMACKLYSLLCVDLARARARAGLSAGPDAHKPGRARQYTIVGDMSHVSCPHVRRLAIAVCAAPGVLTVRCAVCPVPRPAGPRQHGPRPRGTEIESRAMQQPVSTWPYLGDSISVCGLQFGPGSAAARWRPVTAPQGQDRLLLSVARGGLRTTLAK